MQNDFGEKKFVMNLAQALSASPDLSEVKLIPFAKGGQGSFNVHCMWGS